MTLHQVKNKNRASALYYHNFDFLRSENYRSPMKISRREKNFIPQKIDPPSPLKKKQGPSLSSFVTEAKSAYNMLCGISRHVLLNCLEISLCVEQTNCWCKKVLSRLCCVMFDVTVKFIILWPLLTQNWRVFYLKHFILYLKHAAKVFLSSKFDY